MKRIIFLSDLHIGLSKKEIKFAGRIVKKIADTYPGSPVIIAGDLTDSAKRDQFISARTLLNKLAQTNPILTVPGNHDYAWKGNVWQSDAWRHWMKYLGTPLGWPKQNIMWTGVTNEPIGVDGLGVWQDGECVYFGIDSGDPGDKQHTARGYISKGLAYALMKSLKKYKGKTRIAILHHHPFTAGIGALFTGLHGSSRLMKALENNCELLLFGHKHEYGIWWDKRKVPLIVSSHKSTKTFSGDCLTITIIEIDKPGTPNVSFNHHLVVL